MKRFLILMAVLLVASSLQAQNAACMGLKNPTSFTMYSNYSGQTGTKPYTTPNPLTGVTGMTFSGTTYSNTQLASQTSSHSCSGNCSSALNSTNRFRIMSATEGPGTGINVGKDPCVSYNLPYCPTGFTNSIRVGTCGTGAEAEALYYTMTVNANNALVFVNYAIVVEAPGHGVSGDPTFVVRVTKQNSSGVWEQISDTLCYMVSSTPSTSSGGTVVIGQNGWHSQGSGYSQVYYRDWNKVAINLYKYLYQQVRIEVMIGDCAAQGHYGYCYMTGDCKPMRLTANGCAAGESDTVATIAAPSGLSAYKWYRSRTGQTTSQAVSDYQLISGATDSVLSCNINDFILTNGDTVTQQSFMCEMTSYMDPQKPITSRLYTDVGNKKPTITVDSLLFCDGTVTLTDHSFTRFVENENVDKVDTNNTRWRFYDAGTLGPVYEHYGGSASYTYPSPGMHTVKVRVAAYDSTCWNEKTIRVRSLSLPQPHFTIPQNDLCKGDQIIVVDDTPGTISRRWWVVHHADGTTDTATVVGAAFNNVYDSTEVVELIVRNGNSYRQDTNMDGYLETVWCQASYFDTVRVQKFPELTVTGDTIVCMGSQAVVNVTADVPGCTFEWYYSPNGANPFQSGATMTDSPTDDRTYYVKAISPNGCESWDTIKIYMVEPELRAPVTQICKDESVHLYASNAYSYTWTSMPDDPSLVGQENHEEVIVTPAQTTTYTMTGHGMNNCDANPLSVTVRVFPYPVPTFEQTPDFVDSEEPEVTFRDVSPNSTSSLWNFGNGETSTDRQVRHVFTDLTQDSILLSLTTGNELGCTADTNWWIPVELFSVWFPNVFTPTLGTNRTFKNFTHNALEYYTLYVFDRRGDLVFYSKDQNEEWDGTHNGKLCDQGIYVYRCSYRRPGTTDIVTQRGTVTLLQ